MSGPSGAAAKLGIPRSTLDSRIRSLKINKHRFKAFSHLLYKFLLNFRQFPRSRHLLGPRIPSSSIAYDWYSSCTAPAYT
jgi:hypothetical protein